jgi:hypothetical protein
MHQAREHLRELARARARPADDGDVLLEPGLERDALDQLGARFVDQREVRRLELALARQRRRIGERLHLGRRHLAVGEHLDHLLVLDLDVEALLVPVDQLLHRAGQVLVRRDHGDQRADVEAADDHQVAAHRVEQERRDLRQEVVEELDQELALVELEADAEDAAEARRDLGALVVRGAVGVDLGRAVDRLRDAPASARAVNCRSRPSTSRRLRSRGITTAWIATTASATRPSAQCW